METVAFVTPEFPCL